MSRCAATPRSIRGQSLPETNVQRSFSLLCALCTVLPAHAAFPYVPYANDGILDRSFGSLGRTSVAVDLGGRNRDRGLDILPDGSGGYLVLAQVETAASTGAVQAEVLAFVRLNANGERDTTFGAEGVKVTALAATPLDAFLDTSGRIVVALHPFDNTVDSVARFTPAGDIDVTFAGDGSWEPTNPGERIFAVGPATDGGVWVSKRENAATVNVELRHLDGNGVATATTSSTIIPGMTLTGAAPMQIDAWGRIWWAPTAIVDGQLEQTVIRLNAQGEPDPFYSVDGAVHVPFPSNCPLTTPHLAAGQLVLLPEGGAVIRGLYPMDDGATLTAIGADHVPGPMRCDTGDLDSAIAARDDHTFLAATTACDGACGFGLRRYRIAADNSIDLDPTPSLHATMALFESSSTIIPMAFTTALILDDGKPVVVGYRQWSALAAPESEGRGDFDVAVVRYGGRAAIFADGAEDPAT